MVHEPKLKANKARERAKNADVAISISGLPLTLNVAKNERIAATTLLKGTTKDRAVSSYVASSPFHEGAEIVCDKYEAAS